jgi:hypothetical protein
MLDERILVDIFSIMMAQSVGNTSI